MERASDRRFDPNIAAQLLLDVARAESLEVLCQRLVARAVERAAIDCLQIWLVDQGDLCGKCPQRARCPDQSRCVHLTASKGRGLGATGQRPHPCEDRDARVPLGVGPIGETVASGEARTVTDLSRQPGALPGLEWLHQERISGYSITPIRFKGEALGAIATFTRTELPEELGLWGRIFADHLGAAIAQARAFQEIRQLKAQLELQNAYLQEAVVEAKACGDLVGQSAALRHIVSQIDLVAPTEAAVLILGETGTGKELVAHEIHRRSQRREGPLVRVNCASVPHELFESEFFGHVRGSFTGAVKDRAGRFETAQGGTIFLDEVGEIPLDVQNKLLRVLQEKSYERVGDDRTRRADARILAATNRDLKQAVAAGKFREDLFYRLNVFPVNVPPLRERLDDIPALAKHFVELSTRDLKTAKPRLTRAGIVKLQSYDWPGNVRELRNVIERAVILARGGVLEFDLPMGGQPARPLRPPPAASEAGGPEILTEAELQRRERDNLCRALEKTAWKVKGPDGAAELLGVNPATLLSRIRTWGLTKPPVKKS